MNERIRELALKAKLGGAEFDNGIRYYVGTAESFERFAELIVRECVTIVVDAVDHREPASTYASKIQQHFGVEE